MRRAAFHTLGCKTNSYETQAIREQFEKAGYEIVGFSERADVYIINTCSVTAVASQKSRQMIHRVRKLSPDALVAACGCYAQEASEKLLADGSVDLVIGNNEKSKILTLVEERLQSLIGEGQGKERPEILVDDLSGCREYEPQSITNAGDHVRAYVKIQDGCNRFCSYCIIPYLRGRSRSRDPEEILKEVKTLAESGIREIVLTGIDISDYRKEDGEKSGKDSGGSDLAELIFQIEEVQGIERIRLGSLEAGIITPEFLKAIRASKKLCPHFHLSLQSGCDATLKRMNRHYTTEEFLDSLNRIRGMFELPSVTTDVIAGFAGETAEEFSETKEFVRKAGFSQLHVFPYSRRKGTRADRMSGQLTKAEKALRAGELIAIGEELQEAYMSRFLGREIKILAEEVVRIHGQDHLIGFTPEYVKAAIPGNIKDVNKIVTIIPKEIISFEREKILI
ncbi:MAG: tRNA (N(6)-L-threonylcarbamoyladenosine(37)-C(2))-methylthiotransferase MtaB [Parasporobacterium sp.]|nr:tRNA (N(6)-L-threonylcarbamoyladenosine(37)-C(2))-methylthiotransferase MtaB [Parasporobacterium sp.]